MIRYTLVCGKSHEFEVWFPSSAACDKQIAKKLVTCPSCGTAKVKKALMAPSVVTSEKKTESRARRRAVREAAAKVAAAMATPASGEAKPEAAAGQMLTGPQREALRKLKELRDKVLAEADYVGPRFAEEARRIHHEETAERGIYGEASPDEVESLLSDGIEVLPVPVLPDDHN